MGAIAALLAYQHKQKSKQRGGEYPNKLKLRMILKKQSTLLLKETTLQELLTLTYIGWYTIALDYNLFIEKAGILPRRWIHPAVKNPGNSWKAYNTK